MAQDEVLERTAESFAGLPIWRSAYRPGEPVGVESVTALARELYGSADPLARTKARGPFRISSGAHGAVLRLSLPLVSSAEVHLARNGDDLVVTVGSYRRLITLPSVLARYRVAGARVEQGELQVRFVEDPVDETGR
jgi:arsenite-transporting ATPase